MAHPFDAFERIFVINLPSREDRRREMGVQFEKVGLGWASPGVELFVATRPADAGSFPSLGTRGCFLSHLGVLRQAQRSGCRTILILEDDVNFVADFRPRMAAITHALSGVRWDFFYGGHKMDSPPVGNGTPVLKIASSDGVQTAHFVALSSAAIALLVPYLEAQLERPAGHPDGGPMHVDGTYSWFRREHPDLVTFVATPEVAYQRASRTDIHELPWHDRAWGVRTMVSQLRRLKNR